MGKRGAKTEAENDFNAAVGHRIATARREAGLTQLRLARDLGIAQGQIYAYEVGAARCSVYCLTRLARRLGIPLERLLPEGR